MVGRKMVAATSNIRNLSRGLPMTSVPNLNQIGWKLSKLAHRENGDNDDNADTHPAWIIVRVGMYSVADKNNIEWVWNAYNHFSTYQPDQPKPTNNENFQLLWFSSDSDEIWYRGLYWAESNIEWVWNGYIHISTQQLIPRIFRRAPLFFSDFFEFIFSGVILF